MPHELAMAKSRCECIENDGGLTRGCHGRCKAADCEDLEELGDVVAIWLVLAGREGGDYRGGVLFVEIGLSF